MDFKSTLLLVCGLIASLPSSGLSEEYNIQELNSCLLDIVVTNTSYPMKRLDATVDGSSTTATAWMFDLIAYHMVQYCTNTSTHIDCDLETEHSRTSGDHARQITDADFMVNGANIKHLKDPYLVSNLDGTENVKMVIYMTTPSGLDYFRWTELVRIIYASLEAINERLNLELSASADFDAPEPLLNVHAPPSSYVQLLISNNWQTSLIIAIVMLSMALVMFIVIVLLSRTKFCKTTPKTEEKDDEEEEADL